MPLHEPASKKEMYVGGENAHNRTDYKYGHRGH